MVWALDTQASRMNSAGDHTPFLDARCIRIGGSGVSWLTSRQAGSWDLWLNCAFNLSQICYQGECIGDDLMKLKGLGLKAIPRVRRVSEFTACGSVSFCGNLPLRPGRTKAST